MDVFSFSTSKVEHLPSAGVVGYPVSASAGLNVSGSGEVIVPEVLCSGVTAGVNQHGGASHNTDLHTVTELAHSLDIS